MIMYLILHKLFFGRYTVELTVEKLQPRNDFKSGTYMVYALMASLKVALLYYKYRGEGPMRERGRSNSTIFP